MGSEDEDEGEASGERAVTGAREAAPRPARRSGGGGSDGGGSGGCAPAGFLHPLSPAEVPLGGGKRASRTSSRTSSRASSRAVQKLASPSQQRHDQAMGIMTGVWAHFCLVCWGVLSVYVRIALSHAHAFERVWSRPVSPTRRQCV
jgi:hypothetical protein